MEIINLRSPKYVSITHANISYAVLDLFIWEGDFLSPPATPKYNIRKNVTSGNTTIGFEISELSRDYIDTKFDGTYTGQNVWVSYNLTAFNSLNVDLLPMQSVGFIGTDGYDYFQEQSNVKKSILLSNNVIDNYENQNIKLPI